jgi:5'-nucleotidase
VGGSVVAAVVDPVWDTLRHVPGVVQAGYLTRVTMRMRQAAWAIAFGVAAMGVARSQEFRLKIIALNDLHGNLQSPGKFSARPGVPAVDAGGVDYLAGYVKWLKSENPDNIVVSAGDLTGGSPLVSNLFHDEGTIEVMNRLGLEINAVGNHEFDRGMKELQRFQHGGCSELDEKTCNGKVVGTPVPFEGAKFEYLAANVFDVKSGKTIFPGYAVKTYHGVKVAFIGVTLQETPTITTASASAGLRFADEAATINAIVRQLEGQGIESFVVLIHQGGFQKGTGTRDINACVGDMEGSPIRPIVGQLDDAVDLVISGHTHEAYVCSLPNRVERKIPVTQASSYGRVVTDIDVTMDEKTKRMTVVKARNIVVDRTNAAIAPNAEIARIADKYAEIAAPLVHRVVGSVAGEVTRTKSATGETPMGDLVADAQWDATSAGGSGGAQVAFTNEGGIRVGLDEGKATFGELFTAQPFRNNLVTMTLTGAQVKTMLEEQFKGCGLGAPVGETPRVADDVLQASEGFSYTWTKSGALCGKVDAGSIKIGGAVVSASAKYRVTVNSLLADGGEQFYVFRDGTDRRVGEIDLDALAAYFEKHSPVVPVKPHRIRMMP